MKKKISVFIVVSAILGIVLGSIYFVNKEKPSIDKLTKDEIKFKEEYEKDNGKYLKINIKEDNNVIYATKDEIKEILNTTGIIYFGFKECPWCRNAIPTLIETVSKEETGNIYYYNLVKERNTLEIKDNKVVETKKGTEFYNYLLNKLGDKIGVYSTLNDDSYKRIYMPTVLFVKDGEIVYMHESTVGSQMDPSKEMTKKQKEELSNKYLEGINLISEYCTDAC